ncbi:SDR family NAD(P)-dependent oxidoreductase [Roseomonas marmotae]|uniref:SDR family oxidoreductase n=1 Tax=Roseomonas marmotae TaxID=2768161 RepID=A0ABS3KIC2_9PROT|nr:SDR family NAD(P)-dependent oxidoreductase [Roseomonas marmotae]MBO1077221.1 SDR family oxidoreductase [Roseomonas marmotae]
MYGLQGRVAIVTGAGSGIGRAIALRMAREGCGVGIFDRDEAGARETAALVRGEGVPAAIAIGGVEQRQEVERGMAALTAELGEVGILVNNAGILRTAPFLDTSAATWRDTLAVNLDGVFHVCQAVLPQMVARQRGVIVNMSSWTGKKGVPNHSAYSASKFAVIGLTQSIAGEMAAHGIRVNAICPGIIVDTQMRVEAEELNRRQGLPDVEERAKSIPLRRPGYPADIARVVAFLASDEADYMTGQAVNITGGLWMT